MRCRDRRVETRSISRHVGYGGLVNELSAIISLEAFVTKAKLCASVSNEINHVTMHIRLSMERKSPAKVGEIIQQNQIIRVA